jgi:Tol biopolymer transport system component
LSLNQPHAEFSFLYTKRSSTYPSKQDDRSWRSGPLEHKFHGRFAPGTGFGRAHAIIRVSIDTGEMVSLTSPAHSIDGDGSLALSPDASTLAFTRTTSGHVSDIFIAPLTKDLQISGNLKRLTFDGKEIGGRVWAPDGRTLVFSSNRSGRLELWRIAAKRSSKPTSLAAAGDDPVDLTISRQTRRLAYHHRVGGESIWRVALRGKRGDQFSSIDELAGTSEIFAGRQAHCV